MTDTITQDPNLTGSGSEAEETSTQTVENPNPNAAPAGSDTNVGAPSFRNPRLAGKSMEEVDRIVSIMEGTIKDQGRALTDASNRPVAAPEAPKEPELPSNEDYFAAPVTTTLNLLEKAIKPLREELARARSEVVAPTHRENARGQFKHFAELEPAIDHLLQQNRIDPTTATPQQLAQFYYLAKGYADEQGYFDNQPKGEPVNNPAPTPAQRPAAPPQHRPSSAPAPAANATQAPTRALTENERRLAREYKMTEAQFIAWQDLDIEDVATTNIGQEAKS